MNPAISLSVMALGFTAMASQIVFMRELLVVFYGNELSIGLILACWLAGGAIGSGLFGRSADKPRFKSDLFISCQIILSVMLPLDIIAIRLVRSALHVNPGELIPLLPMAGSSFIILVPVCALLGFMFALACRIYDTAPSGAAVRIGRVYVLEAIGSVAGGCVASFIMIRALSSLEIAGMLGILNLASAFAMLVTVREIRRRTFLLAASNVLLAVFILMWPLKWWSRIDAYSLAGQWQGYRLVASENSIYGNVAVTVKDGEYSFFASGLDLYTVPDRQRQEEAVHYALLEHRDPKNVLLIGGGAGGLAGEIVKYPIDRCDYLELDPLIVDMSKRYLPAEYRSGLEDTRVKVQNMDGRFFLKNAGRKYDLVILDVGDPRTAEINRFYTIEFFEEVKRALNKGGILAFGLGSSENYINPQLERFLKSIYATLKKAYPDVKVIPGDTAYFLASGKEDTLTYDYKLLMERAAKLRLDIKYVREYYLSSKMSPERIAYAERSMKGGLDINRDFHPISYYLGTIFWTSRFRDSIINKALERINEKGIRYSVLFICASILLSGLYFFKDGRRCEKSALIALSFTGSSVMAAQIIILFAFQVIFGYLYYKLGVVLTSFMIGLALGGALAVRMLSGSKNKKNAFVAVQAALVAYLCIMPSVFGLLAGSQAPVAAWLSSNLFFPAISAIGGFLGGFQFPLANEIYHGPEGRSASKTASLTYGFDLLGSSLGAIFTGAFLIPVIGVTRTCMAFGLMNLAILVILVVYFYTKGEFGWARRY